MGFEEFLEHANEGKKIALSFKNPLIVHHYDADGIAAGAVVKSAFPQQGVRTLALKKLDDDGIEKIRKEKEIIFVDLGNNERVGELKDVIIIDHHQIKEKTKPQINPILDGLDGGSELSSSGTAYFIFRKYLDLGVVGAFGDMQYPFIGANKIMCEQGIASGEIKKTIDLKFYGRFSRPLIQLLAYNDEPFVPGISYNERGAQTFLENLGIELKENEKLRVYTDLSDDEKKILISGIVEVLSKNQKKYDIVGEVYELKRKNAVYDAHEFSTLLNACGRHGKAETGLKLCLNEQQVCSEVFDLVVLHKKMIREGVVFARNKIIDLGGFWFLDGRGVIDEGIIGVVCGMILENKQKPIIGIANGKKNEIKISSRIGKKTEINLGEIISYASACVEGIGGGHKVAAGASIPSNKLNEFLLIFSERLRPFIFK